MTEAVDRDWTRRLACAVGDRIAFDADLLLRARAEIERPGHFADCAPHLLARDAIYARHEWATTALSFLRWLLADWPAEQYCDECRSYDATVHGRCAGCGGDRA